LLLACDYYNPHDLYPEADLLGFIMQGTQALAAGTFPSGNLPSSLHSDDDRYVYFLDWLWQQSMPHMQEQVLVVLAARSAQLVTVWL
jgi:hypothetical protein